MPNRYAYLGREKQGGFSVRVYESSGDIFMPDIFIYEDIFPTKQEAIDYCKERGYHIMNLGVNQ